MQDIRVYRVFLVFILIVTASLMAQEYFLPERPAASAITDVTVLPMTGTEILEHQTVIIQGKDITAVGPAYEVDIPMDANRIDGSGRYLLPGLAEMHGHIPDPINSPEYTHSVLFLYLANGVTTVRGMLGEEGQLALRDRANRGEILSPMLFLAGPPFSGGSIDSPDQAEQRVRRQQQDSWDYLKVLPGLTRAEYDAMSRAAKEVNIPWIGHVPEDVGLLHALNMGQQTFDHIDGYIRYLDGADGPVDEEKLSNVIQRTKESGAWIIPTMAVWETLMGAAPLGQVTGYRELNYLPPDIVEQWTRSHRNRLNDPDFNPDRAQRIVRNRMTILNAMHQADVRILFGTDSPQQFSVPGFSIHREVQRMLDAGMPPHDILLTATRNVGEYVGEKASLGTIEPGKLANLLLLESNPLEEMNRLTDRAGVMIQGRWLPEKRIQAHLSELAAGYGQ